MKKELVVETVILAILLILGWNFIPIKQIITKPISERVQNIYQSFDVNENALILTEGRYLEIGSEVRFDDCILIIDGEEIDIPQMGDCNMLNTHNTTYGWYGTEYYGTTSPLQYLILDLDTIAALEIKVTGVTMVNIYDNESYLEQSACDCVSYTYNVESGKLQTPDGRNIHEYTEKKIKDKKLKYIRIKKLRI